MRAAIYERTGPAQDVLRIAEIPTPTPESDEVLVRLSWSGVNPSDVKTRAGVRTRTLPFPQIIPHSDGAGVITAVGANVPNTRLGERVWTWNAAWGRAFGTAAEFVALPAAQAVAAPDGCELDAAACFGIPALTAWHAVNVDGGVAGRDVLVAGGAGAVGRYAIQIARLMGARKVLATVSSEEKSRIALDAGADVAINYKQEDVVTRAQEATAGAGVHRVIEVDYGANAALDPQLLRPEGELVVYGSASPEIAVPFVPMILKNLRARFFIVYNLSSADRERAIAGLTALVREGRLTHHIAARLPLEHIAAAHDLVESGRAVGNVVIRID